jgi:ligand-binding SRPBCC domain-containing protein
MGHLQTSRLIPAPAAEVFRHITAIENLPEWLSGHIHVDLEAYPVELREQSEIEVVFTRFRVATRVKVRVETLKPLERFGYRQMSGFFRSWSHTQVLRAHNERSTLLTDLVDYQLPFGLLGAFADDLVVRKDIETLLNIRLIKIEEHFLRAPSR